ncbi:hypothetical protein [Mongoliimonas terrestris]|uniref:hypothetical protein n=1 Tax=Mongoliimonas terrestris TaxID=1709001 RepID=UPI000AFF71CA|nr:hypothetical protein [Mongoliimonas terrestris]
MTQLFVIPMTMVVVTARLTLGLMFLAVVLPFVFAAFLLHAVKASARGVESGRKIVDVPIARPVNTSDTVH